MKRAILGFLVSLAMLCAAPLSANPSKGLISLVDPSIGRVMTDQGSGSGFVIGSDRATGDLFFVTNQHVLRGATRGYIGYNRDDRVISYNFKIVSQSAELDLAVVRMSMKDQTYRPPSLKISNYELEKGDPVFALGFPGMSSRLQADRRSPESFETTLTSGVVSKVYNGRWPKRSQTLQIVNHTATINRGNSGGALINYCGSVVGVNTLIFVDENGANLSSSSKALINFLRTADVSFETVNNECDPDAGPSGRDVSPQAPQSGAIPDGPLGLPTWGIVLIALGSVAAIGGGVTYALRHNTAPSPSVTYGDSQMVAGAKRASPSKTALQVKAKLPTGDTKQISVTARQLKDGVTIGRTSSAGITIDSPKISRAHARLRLDGRKLVLQDLGSTNGVAVDGKPLKAKASQQINTSSELMLGDVCVRFQKP